MVPMTLPTEPLMGLVQGDWVWGYWWIEDLKRRELPMGSKREASGVCSNEQAMSITAREYKWIHSLKTLFTEINLRSKG